VKKELRIVDTTLRDGEQCSGVIFSPEDKIKLALLLDEIGVYEVEVGIFDRKTEGREYLNEIMKHRKNAKISLWSRLQPKDVIEACKQKPDLIHIAAPVSYVQIYTKLQKNKAWVEKQLMECMEVANDFHVDVTLGFEDSSRSDVGFMIKLAALAESLGVKTLRVSDTVGIFDPIRAGKVVADIRTRSSLLIEAHEHNDFGMAVANSMEMAHQGAQLIDCTLFGIGERAGNCNMYDFIRACEGRYDMGVGKKGVLQAMELFSKIINVDKEHFTGRVEKKL